MTHYLGKSSIGAVLQLIITDAATGLPVDLSTATSLSFYLSAPSGTVITRTPTFTTDGVDGSIEYVTIAGDLDEEGIWRWQAQVNFAARTLYSQIVSFEVFKNLA